MENEVKAVFEFIQAKQKEKKEYNDEVNGIIKGCFESLVAGGGDIRAVKHSYERWLMIEQERKMYDNTMSEIAEQLKLHFEEPENERKK